MLAIAAALGLALGAGPVRAYDDDDDGGHGRGFCSATALVQRAACRNEVRDDSFTAQAICINLSDGDERRECLRDAKAESQEASQLCREQLEARRDVCDVLGEDRYDPEFDPADFETDFHDLAHPNPYFPLRVGSRWQYAGGEETVAVEILDKTKLIEGVTCVVSNDRVEEDGTLVEDTDDWFAQRKDGTVVYCGEIARNFETFEGDEPEEPELVDVEGSWKAGRDGDKPGFLFLAAPSVGDVYRQEWSPGNAEDVAEVLSTTYGYGKDRKLDQLVPRALAELLCAGDCVVTGEFTALEPDVFERKYYARGVGLFLEVNPETREVVQLVGCNVDPRCAALATP
jgi:hypothetical protein